MQPTPVLLPGEFLGQRWLVGYGPWGRKESNMSAVTEHAHAGCSVLHVAFSVWSKWELFSIAEHRLVIVVASLIALGVWASVVEALGL